MSNETSDAPSSISADSISAIAAEDAAAARADASERVKIQASIADAMMKALLWANGGAMVALFTFIGNLLAKGAARGSLDSSKLWIAFGCFVAGLIAALLCHFSAFVSQDRFYNVAAREVWRHQRAAAAKAFEPPTAIELSMNKQGFIAYGVGLLVACLSTVLFAGGCGFALAGVLL